MIVWLLRWSDGSTWRRLVMCAGLLLVPAGAAVLVARMAGPVAVAVGAVAALVTLVWAVVTMPKPRQWHAQLVEAQFDPEHGPAPCALCGYNCIPGSFWAPVPGYLNAVMHIRPRGCGPAGHGEERLAAPTHLRDEGGRYRLIGDQPPRPSR